jgi:Putative DNA-binding domain
MPALVELQQRIRDVVLGGSADPMVPLLVGGSQPALRLGIHRRHYQASLVDALLSKFPACAWVLGTPIVAEAARAFVRCHPPPAPCIAEFGAVFPEFLAVHAEARSFPCVLSLAKLEWHLGHIAIAVDACPISMDALAAIDAALLPDAVLELQSGVRYLDLEWPVDELIKLYLADNEPEHFHLEPAAVCLELRGARGTFHINRLDRATFVFRGTVAEGSSIGAAAEHALEVNPDLDVGRALAALMAENLVVGVASESAGGAR